MVNCSDMIFACPAQGFRSRMINKCSSSLQRLCAASAQI
ncbi:hypothetical protein VTO73DRAFT_2050 [Trametes versicolor]